MEMHHHMDNNAIYKKNLRYIKTNHIENDQINDVRINPEYNDNDESFAYLKQNIKVNGIMNPIHVTQNKNKNGFYVVVDGRRRFESMKQLGYKEIECFVIDSKSEAELQVIALIQNLHRKDINDIERCTAIRAIFEKVGYSVENIITNCKRIHNEKSTKNVDREFVQVWKSIGYSANFTYQLMQLLKDLPFNVLKYAERNDLNTQQKILLTHTKLREHPQLQKELVDELKKTKDIKLSRLIVYQTIRDLETEALFKSGESYHLHTHLRDKITQTQVEYSPFKHYFELLKHSNDLLRNLTGHQFKQGEYEYNKDHVNYSAQHRIDIIKSLDSRSITALREQLMILRYAIDSMQSVIAGEEQEVTKT